MRTRSPLPPILTRGIIRSVWLLNAAPSAGAGAAVQVPTQCVLSLMSSGRMLYLSGRAAQLRDHPERRPPGLHALDVVEAIAVGLRPVVPRRPGAVRREGDVGQREERVVLGRRLLHHHVEAGGGDGSRRERLIQRVLV